MQYKITLTSFCTVFRNGSTEPEYQAVSDITLLLKPGFVFVNLSDLQRDLDLFALGFSPRCISIAGAKKLRRWFFYNPSVIFDYRITITEKKKFYEKKKTF